MAGSGWLWPAVAGNLMPLVLSAKPLVLRHRCASFPAVEHTLLDPHILADVVHPHP